LAFFFVALCRHLLSRELDHFAISVGGRRPLAIDGLHGEFNQHDMWAIVDRAAGHLALNTPKSSSAGGGGIFRYWLSWLHAD
jgi:hypothetical protein